MPAPTIVQELVTRFERDFPQLRSSNYNEAHIRQEFINPFFRALGWDMDNSAGRPPHLRDVIHEDKVMTADGLKAPDYAFRVGGDLRFYVEAKKPAVNLKEHALPAFQVRRYGWSASVPLSILTDFEELAVYDCRVEPKADDQPSIARLKYLTYKEYIDQWDWLQELFSRQAVQEGSLNAFAGKLKEQRGLTTVDTAFLRDMSQWREILARNIARCNPGLNQRELNYAIQMTLDRIIFLRISEDRDVEPYGRLKELLDAPDIYQNLLEYFRQADNRYNSGLFHFEKTNGEGEGPDRLTPGLTIENDPLRQVIGRLYYPQSPYAFKVIPVEILGQVYEQFLGKVVRLAENHEVVVEEKPEVRKAGGVYYTPTYIVDYIVRHTVGKLLEGRAPAEVAQLRILDPACGSGSFLLGAYQFLLDWHLEQYRQSPRKYRKELQEGPDGQPRLTLTERKRILLNNIFGVDIDQQAVEVTKLSLLLKVLEGENSRSTQMTLALERVLPDLGNNIKCGNSLIGYDFYQQMQLPLLSDDDFYRINVFDWEIAFPQVFKAGGFDAVIGNPPYIRVQALNEWAPIEVNHYKKAYRAASKGNYDIYVVFVERALSLLNPHGRLGFILPHKFFNAQYGQPLRQLLSQGQHLSKVVHFGDQQIFNNATTYTCLLFLNKQASAELDFTKVDSLKDWLFSGKAQEGKIPVSAINKEGDWNFNIGKGANLFDRLKEIPTKLVDISEKMFQGLVTSADSIYLLEPLGIEKSQFVKVWSNAKGKEYQLETEVVWPLCKGSRDIRRYSATPSKRVLFPYDPQVSAISGKTTLISSQDFASNFPHAWQYLLENEKALREREKGKMQHEGWYGYVYPKSVSLFAKKKILTPSIAANASYTIDNKGELYFVGSGGGGGGGYGIILNKDCELSYEFLLGLLNSKLLDYYLKQVSSRFRGGYYAYNKQYIEQLPIHTINFNDPADRKRHDELVKLVEKMLELQKQLGSARMPQEEARLKHLIAATDREIDRQVYALYDLTEAEIALIEQAGA
ncbi:MAG TPA: N-6 DNA methylase [Chloroflexia bacterium]|nr:N-6 DNA methylase [Chloroflexia bacterium]